MAVASDNRAAFVTWQGHLCPEYPWILRRQGGASIAKGVSMNPVEKKLSIFYLFSLFIYPVSLNLDICIKLNLIQIRVKQVNGTASFFS